MSHSMRAASSACQSPAGDVERAPLSTTVDVDLAILRKVIEDLGWTCEAIAAAMGRGESYRTHVFRVVNGERPMSHAFLKALPDDIEVEWHARLAEQGGRIVVAPLSGADAVRSLVGGLIGMLAPPQLPVKASGMARAALPTKARRLA